ncbi:DUF2207 domain-containing protein [Bacillus sp. FJAT-22090]|uniref:DUF2207 domain-containing protein n=1 Tax=Bacillus sp. FJAT-22090 TaxID=1581038 RepID=UPI0016429C4D|nr:DUF2207 domain-containing protein [Bacillus sp. FJAT-22090]
MKKIIFSIVLLLLTFSCGVVVHAKEYSIDTIHIKSWIQPNGDLLVNEVFTYNFVGSYTNLSRSFPKEHDKNIVNFYSYELAGIDLEPGFIEDGALKQLNVTKENGVYRTSVNKADQKVSFLYVYTLKNAVKAFDKYSVADVTYFEDGDAHNQDFHHVTIDYILPKTTDPANFDGVLFDRNALKNGKSQYGIRFTTPISEAFSETKTVFFFPSSMMTQMAKVKSSVSMEEAFAKEKQKAGAIKKRLSYIPMLIELIPKISFALIVLALLFLVALPQRHFWRKGPLEYALDTDVLYLFYIYNTGKLNRKSFIAGLFSLVEKGAASVKTTEAAIRFKDDPKAPKETLLFQLKKGGIAKSLSENELIQWLFRTKSGSSKWVFHLHDAAGSARKEKNKQTSNYFHVKTKDFKKKQREWHKKVHDELVAAGTFHHILPKTIVSLVIVCLSVITAWGYYADLRSIGSIVFIVIITLLLLVTMWSKRASNWFFVIYMVLINIMAGNIVNDSLSSEIIGLSFVTILLYIAVPRNILSMNAVRAKDTVRSFRKSIRTGMPATLSIEEQEKWSARAYLFGKRNIQLPVPETTIPLAALLLTETDPMDYVVKSWRWTSGPTSSGGSSDTGGSFSGGGGDSGGGGAGAD